MEGLQVLRFDPKKVQSFNYVIRIVQFLDVRHTGSGSSQGNRVE